MQLAKFGYLLLFIACYGCKGKEKEKAPETLVTPGEGITIRIENCDSIITIFRSKDLCGKIAVISSYRYRQHHCLVEMVRELTRITGLDNSLNYGTGGIGYPYDSLLITDIDNWKKELNCK